MYLCIKKKNSTTCSISEYTGTTCSTIYQDVHSYVLSRLLFFKKKKHQPPPSSSFKVPLNTNRAINKMSPFKVALVK